MGCATPLPHRTALASITAALRELEEWRAGTREHANMVALRSHCDEIEARSRDDASAHPDYARLQLERDAARSEAARLSVELAAALEHSADMRIPDDAERKAKLWDWLRTLICPTKVGPSDDDDAVGLGASGSHEEDVARVLRRLGVAVAWQAESHEIGERIAERLERAS